jgi:cyclopropane-fatty-acyl-phospholipid synthase
LFQAFLSSDMNYSSAIWERKVEHEAPETAQLRKVHNIIEKAEIQSCHHILDIGCGWGSLAMEAVKLRGCKVTGLTLSAEQKMLAEDRIAKAGLSDRIEVLLCDDRMAPVPPAGYNRIVSVEMIEYEGRAHMGRVFEELDKRLNKYHGLVVIQGISAN